MASLAEIAKRVAANALSSYTGRPASLSGAQPAGSPSSSLLDVARRVGSAALASQVGRLPGGAPTAVSELAGLTAPAPGQNALAVGGVPTLAGLPGFSAPGSGAAANYDRQFTESLGRARSGIETQLRNALTEVGRQEASQLQAVGQLPGEYARLADLARAQVNETTTNADAALAATGVQGLAPAGTGAAPLLSAMALGQATQQAGVPLLDLGVRDTAGRARGGLEQAKLSAFERIDSEERQYAAQRAAEERDNAMRVAQMQYEAKVAQTRAANDMKMAQFEAAQRQQTARDEAAQANALRDQDFQRDIFKLELGAKLRGSPGATSGNFGALEVSAKKGSAIASSAADKYRDDSAYRLFVSAINQARAGDDEVTLDQLTAQFTAKYPKANRNAMSLAMYDVLGAGK